MNEVQKAAGRILIVDDTLKNIQVIGTILKHKGYHINIARDGVQALDMVGKTTPDLILMDIMMPKLNGFETCIELKKNPETKDIPIIFLTAKTATENIVKGFEAGAVDYVTKPFNAMELLVRVKTQLELKFSRDAIQKASNERKELLHVLCHDLANPLHQIISVLDIVKTHSQFQEMQKLLLYAAGNGLDLIRLVREMELLEEHKLKLKNINLLEAITESADMLGKRFTDKRIKPEINVKKDLYVLAERASLVNSVINNIFTNAIKFSYPDSKIIVTAEPAAACVKFSIRDFGIGMPGNLLKNLFDVRKTTSRMGTEGEEGTGFGMPLMKKFVNAYGGAIEIFSKAQHEAPQNHGTTVVISCPEGK